MRVKWSSRMKWVEGIVALVSLLLLVALMTWLRPGVPKDVTILTGAENSQSHRFAERYATYVEEHGIRAKVVSTAGSGEILRRFSDASEPMVGFLQSGVEREVGDRIAPTSLQSLGSLYLEPIWLFVQNGAGIDDVHDFAGKRVFSGQPGSDARAAVRSMLRVYELDADSIDSGGMDLTPDEAADALLSGELDAVFLAGESDKGPLMRLLASDAVRPVPAKHAEVFTRIQPDVADLLVLQGLFSLGQMLPREDIRVIAPAINLVTSEGFHPALVDLFLDAASKIHGGATHLSNPGEFPSERYTSLPLNDDAKRYYKNGPSGLRRYLPFWLASLIEQLLVYGLPVFVVLSSVFKGIPVVLKWKTKLELANVYRRIQVIENAHDHLERRDEYLQILKAAEDECDALRVPRMHLPQYFELRQYIHDLHKRIEEA